MEEEALVGREKKKESKWHSIHQNFRESFQVVVLMLLFGAQERSYDF